MTVKPKSESFDFVVGLLEKNPEAPYAEIAAAAQKKGFKIYPIVYGRAKAKLGLVPTAPRGSGAARKMARKKAEVEELRSFVAEPAAAPARRAPAAPMPSIATTGLSSGLESVISHVKASEAERARFRKALEQIRSILEAALA